MTVHLLCSGDRLIPGFRRQVAEDEKWSNEDNCDNRYDGDRSDYMGTRFDESFHDRLLLVEMERMGVQLRGKRAVILDCSVELAATKSQGTVNQPGCNGAEV